MASTDALPIPQKNVAYRVTFPILDADGDLVTGAAGLDSEVSKDGGTFADCTNEATEIATSSGIYYLDLTSTEMNADTVAVIVKTSTSGAKTTTLVFYPEEAGDVRVNVTAYGGTAGTFSGGRPEVNATHAAGTAWGSGAITAASIAASALNGKGDWLLSSSTGSGFSAIPWNASWDAEVQSECADALTAYDPPTNAEMEARTLAAADYATAATQTTIANYIDTEVAAIKAKTDNLPAAPAATGDAMTLTAAYDFAKGTVAMTESYAADGAAMTPAQVLHMIWALLAERSIVSTTLTAKKLDGSTTAMTFSLDSTTPTAQTRAT